MNLGFKLKDLMGGAYLGHPGVDDRIMLKCIVEEIGSNSVDWISLAQDKCQWWAVVNTAITTGFMRIA
jgi:hypothetical protein